MSRNRHDHSAPTPLFVGSDMRLDPERGYWFPQRTNVQAEHVQWSPPETATSVREQSVVSIERSSTSSFHAGVVYDESLESGWQAELRSRLKRKRTKIACTGCRKSKQRCRAASNTKCCECDRRGRDCDAPPDVLQSSLAGISDEKSVAKWQRQTIKKLLFEKQQLSRQLQQCRDQIQAFRRILDHNMAASAADPLAADESESIDGVRTVDFPEAYMSPEAWKDQQRASDVSVQWPTAVLHIVGEDLPQQQVHTNGDTHGEYATQFLRPMWDEESYGQERCEYLQGRPQANEYWVGWDGRRDATWPGAAF